MPSSAVSIDHGQDLKFLRIEGRTRTDGYPVAFFMAIDLLFLLTMNNLLHFESIDDWWFLPLFMGYGIYLWLSLRKVYGKSGIVVQFMRFLGSLFSLIACIILYRQMVTILTVWQM